MSITRLCRKFIRKTLFGDALLPQAFTIGLVEPQTEIAVWLHGMGTPIDVTYRHSMACADPFTVCIAFDEGRKPSESERSRLTLWFCEQDGQKRILGKIVLGPPKPQTVSAADREFILFEARSSANYCLSRARTWAYYLLHRYSLWRKVDVAGIKMSFLERRAVMVMFIRPHPVVLVSLGDEDSGNIFPMNIMGELDGGHIAFALKEFKASRASGGASWRRCSKPSAIITDSISLSTGPKSRPTIDRLERTTFCYEVFVYAQDSCTCFFSSSPRSENRVEPKSWEPYIFRSSNHS